MAAIQDHGDTSPDLAIKIPPIDRFNLPAVLKFVKPLGCTQPNLFDYLRMGRLRAVCFPYRLEPDREVAIEPEDWKERFRDLCGFAIFDGFIGETDATENEPILALHMIPSAVKADCHRVIEDGGFAATAAIAYVRQEELVRFKKWLSDAMSDSQHGPQEPAEASVPDGSEDGPAPPRKKPTIKSRRGGRKKGSGSLASKDAPLIEAMKLDIAGGKSHWGAAMLVVGEASGNGSDESKAKRLVGRYKEWEKNNSE